MDFDQEKDFDYYQGVATSSFGDMLHDHERNEKFGLALKKAIEKVHKRGEAAHVLDIGAGTGLLSMLAVSHGADTVVACEMFEPVADCALQIIEANGFAHRIKLIKKHSLELTVGEDGDLPRKANILVSEVFDTELIGEGAIATFNHAHSVLLEDDCIVIPSVGTIYGQIIESPSLLKWHRLEEWFQADKLLVDVPSDIKSCPGVPALFDFQLSQFPINEFTPLTNPITLFKFDFMRCNKLPRLQYETFSNKIHTAGKAHAVLTWWDLIMDDEGEVILSCAPVWHHPDGPKILPAGNPALGIPWRDHWMQSAYFFRKEYEVSQNSTLRAWHDEFSYWFALCLCDNPGKDDCRCKREQLPACDCSLHMIASRTRLAAMNCPRRRSALYAFATELVKKGNVFIVLGDFSLLPFLLCKLGAQRVFIATNNDTNMASQRIIQEFIQINSCHQATLCNLKKVSEQLRNAPELQKNVCVVSEPFYETSILPWDNMKFLTTLQDFFSLTGDFLDKKLVKVYPSSFEIRACCVKFDDLWKISRPVDKCMGFDVKIFDELISHAKSMAEGSPEAQPLWEYPCKALSHPITILKWESNQDSHPTKEVKTLQIGDPAQPADGIAFWIDYTLMPGLTISTGPLEQPVIGCYIPWDRYERQGVHLYESPQYGPNLTCQLDYNPVISSTSFTFTES